MLNNPQAIYVQRGEAIDYKNASTKDFVANEVISLSTRIGIAGNDIPIGMIGTAHVTGVYDIPASTTEAFNVGQAVYWKDTMLVSTAAGAVPAGWVVESKVTLKNMARIKIG